MIDKYDLKKGLVVVYVPSYIKNKYISDEVEWGEVTSWNESYVFVNYDGPGGKATRYEDLYLKDAYKAGKLLNE